MQTDRSCLLNGLVDFHAMDFKNALVGTGSKARVNFFSCIFDHCDLTQLHPESRVAFFRCLFENCELPPRVLSEENTRIHFWGGTITGTPEAAGSAEQ